MPSFPQGLAGVASLLLLVTALTRIPDADAQTAVTPVFPANVVAPVNERDSAVARYASGRTVIVWEDAGTIRARRFDAAGAPLDDGFVVDAAGAINSATLSRGNDLTSTSRCRASPWWSGTRSAVPA